MFKAYLAWDRIVCNIILVLSFIHYTSIVLLNWNRLYIIVCLDTNIFIFLLFIFLDLIFLFFWFSFFFIDDEEACDCGHMTYHMMWGHKPRLG